MTSSLLDTNGTFVPKCCSGESWRKVSLTVEVGADMSLRSLVPNWRFGLKTDVLQFCSSNFLFLIRVDNQLDRR